MDYQLELKKTLELKRVLEVLIRGLTEMKPEYLPLNTAVISLLLGDVPTLHVDCEDGDDGECEVTGREPIGGLWQKYEGLREVVEALELELDFELPSKVHYTGPEYQV